MRIAISHLHSANVRPDDGNAFLRDPFERGWCRHVHPADAFADELAREFVSSATSAEEAATDARAELTTEEFGGPFVVTSAQTEFGATVNERNPPIGDRAGVPTSAMVTRDSDETVRSQIERERA
jgi:hypothetical protein